MKTLIFQVVLKQWDKSQRTDEHSALRAAIEDRYAITTNPQFMVLEAQCIVDQHAVNFSGDAQLSSGNHAGRTLKKSMLTNRAIKLDNLVISNTKTGTNGVNLHFEDTQGELHHVGELNNNWAQVKYQWRYSVEKDNQIFWLYEAATFNVAYVDELDADYFLKKAPNIYYDAQALLP